MKENLHQQLVLEVDGCKIYSMLQWSRELEVDDRIDVVQDMFYEWFNKEAS